MSESSLIDQINYTTYLPSGAHWSLRMRKGTVMRLKNVSNHANVGMLFYNPENMLERYNAPDTLKCQHTFKLTQGHCLYSDMGRIFASVVEDSLGWHDTVCGNSHASHIKQWGLRDYQHDRNDWLQNGHDAFLVELAKYGLSAADLAANINWFSQVTTDEQGNMCLVDQSTQGHEVTLRFEMDTLVMLHTCPHPLERAKAYPQGQVEIALGTAAPVQENDTCKNACAENLRGFQNNDLYHIGR